MSDLSALHDMTLFVEVARTKNFSAAGRNLGVPVATLSRRIAAVEREFGVRLFDRTTRRVELTEAGARCFERGMGIDVLAPDLARDALASVRLVRVLPQWSMTALPVHAVTSSRLQPARVKAFVAFLADRLQG